MNQTDSIETNDGPDSRGHDAGYRTAVRIAAVAGVFSLVVSALLLYDYSRRDAENPLEAASFRALKLAQAAQPDNEKLKEEIRVLDLELRTQYFRQRQFSRVGAWLLLGGVAVFLIAAKSAVTLRRKLPTPGLQTTPHDLETRWTQIGRWAVAGLTLILIGTAVGLSLAFRSDGDFATLLESAAGKGQPRPPAQLGPPPSEQEIRKMWPRFRGPGGLGVSAYTNVPDTWDAGSGENILWKVPVPLPGNNSPVVWGERVFLSGATPQRREVYCFDAGTGKLLWQKEVPGTPQSRAKPPEVGEDTGYAAPTTITDGRWVFAMFANGDVAAFDFDGNPAWSRSLGIPENSYGHAASLAMFENLLLVQFDQAGRKDGKSKLLALDVTQGGKTAWEVAREVPNSWPSPIVIHHSGRHQIITCADPWVIAYDPADGAEIWRAKCLRQDIGPSPTFADGVVYVVSEFPALSAIRADGKGDVTETHVLWRGEDGLPDTCSPLATDRYVFLLASFGTLTCYDAKQGELLWEEEFDASFLSSPSLVAERLYLISDEGKAWIVEPGREGCKRISEADLGEDCTTSPAFQEGRIYLRGKKHLFCIGQ